MPEIDHDTVMAEIEARDPEFKRWRQESRPLVEFRAALIRARGKAGLTQKALAEKIGVKQSIITRLESGQAKPCFDVLPLLSEALDVSIIFSGKRVIAKPNRAV